jgi:hypothetical protein
MNKELWQKFDQLRACNLNGADAIQMLIQKEGIRFSPKDISTWSRFFSQSLWMGGHLIVPDWLATVFGALAEEKEPKSICDPWAGVGFLIETLRETCRPSLAIAFNNNQSEFDLGNSLTPEVKWLPGDPLILLRSSGEEIDLVASILPFGAKSNLPLDLPSSSGESIQISGDLGNQILAASALRLSTSGIGLFVVTQSFFLKKPFLEILAKLGIAVKAALALPRGTFAPYTNIPAYLLVVRKGAFDPMFVGELSSEPKINLQIIENLHQDREGGALELGRFVNAAEFQGINQLRALETMKAYEKRLGVEALNLGVLGDVKTGIRLGRHKDGFEFEPIENAIYIPVIGESDVVLSPEEFHLKAHNYAQVAIDSTRSDARFVARFLNSEIGRNIRQQSKGGLIPRFNILTLKELQVLVPDLAKQRQILELDSRIAAEQNIVLGLQNEIAEMRRELWGNPASMEQIHKRVTDFSFRLGGIKQHTAQSLEQWCDTLPFPLASILRAWQATSSRDYKTKYGHLLHFFEGTAQFVGIIILSAFKTNEEIFAPHRKKLLETMQKQNMGFERATWGVWKLVVEYLGKQTRLMLGDAGGKDTEAARTSREICAEIFADPSLALPRLVSRKELATIISVTNKMRNDWDGHGGVVGQEESEARNQQLVGELQKLREVMEDTWTEMQLIRCLGCQPRKGIFENEVSVLMGSNNEFLKETRSLATWLDVESLYLLSKNGSNKALKLLPLIQVGPSPQSAKNACYFFNRLEKNGVRFVSYHFIDKPELTDTFADATEAIKLLKESSGSDV